ncbi:hypothetical protein QMK38_16300 [Lysinibacillus fusiformis]|nr:hypothetical protein [Lysinibacillus fusiformis]
MSAQWYRDVLGHQLQTILRNLQF